ncbi:MAG: sulfatase-like hydrolase/transferase, partial [Opitutae bacterium]
MKHSSFVFLLALFIGSSHCTWAKKKPNVIIIMADYIGAEGLACYGSTIYTTPHLDRMADEGARFNNAYATPLCTPTRVMIMSGLYPPRTGFRSLIGKDKGVRMPASIRTFGHDFRDAGYAT